MADKNKTLISKLERNGIPRTRLNQNNADRQRALSAEVESFCAMNAEIVNGSPVYFMRNGMLSEICTRTPFFIFDLPQLARRVTTACTDGIAVYFNADFHKALEHEYELIKESVTNGEFSLKFNERIGQSFKLSNLFANTEIKQPPIDPREFLIAHELEHMRRIHCQRMTDLPHDIANIAQDIRINTDIIRMFTIEWMRRHGINASQLHEEEILKVSAVALAVTRDYSKIITSGAGTEEEDLRKWAGKSEEQIGAELMRERKDQREDEEDPSREISFQDLCEAISQDFQSMAANPAKAPTQGGMHSLAPADATRIAVEVQALGKAKGQAPAQTLQAIAQDIDAALSSIEMQQRNAEHVTLKNKGLPSVKVNDQFIADMMPSNRAELLLQILNMKLNPQQGNSDGSGMKIKDLMDDGFGGSGDDHVMTPEEMKQTMDSNGLENVSKSIGYDEIKKQMQATESSVVEAINRAENDRKRSGGKFPGEHMVDYASEKKTEFYEPAINWKFKLKEIIQQTGKTLIKDDFEPSSLTLSMMDSPGEFGLESEYDVIYEGSVMPAKRERSRVIVLLDTSGSMFMWGNLANGERMLERLISEIAGIAKENNDDSAPNVTMLPADTIIRGEPLEITPENFEEYIREGIDIGGMGGTNLTASLQNVIDWFKEGGRFEGEACDGILYFTDSYDAPPTMTDIEKFVPESMEFPNIVWFVPRECHQDHFEKSVSGYSTYIKFNPGEVLEIDLEKIEAGKPQRSSPCP